MYAQPQDVNISAEYLNMSFLIRKPNGSQILVTAFSKVGQYSKPQPTLMPRWMVPHVRLQDGDSL